MKKKRKRLLHLPIRRYLQDPQIQYGIFFLCANYLYMNTFVRSMGDAVVAILVSAYAVWTLKSSLLYGFISTVETQVAIPFVIAGAIAAYLGSIKTAGSDTESSVDTDTANLISNKIQSLINEAYSCSFDRLDRQKDGWYVYLSLPFGLAPDFADIVNKLERELHIPDSHIAFAELTKQHVYAYIPESAIRAYNDYWDRHAPWSVHALKQRLLLRPPST